MGFLIHSERAKINWISQKRKRLTNSGNRRIRKGFIERAIFVVGLKRIAEISQAAKSEHIKERCMKGKMVVESECIKESKYDLIWALWFEHRASCAQGRWQIWASGALLRASLRGSWRSGFEGSSLVSCPTVNTWEAGGIL